MREKHYSRDVALLDIIDSTEKLSFRDEKKDMSLTIQQYLSYKKGFVRNMKFDANSYYSGMYTLSLQNALELNYPTLEVIEIYFGAATYDEIEKDVKVTLEAALGLIGGTMGLLTGFSILSGVEIIFYIIKLLFSLRMRNSD